MLVATNVGEFTLELYPEKAPKTVENFLAYVDEKFYDATIFHRVIDGFMIQGGGFTPDMNQKKCKAPIENEAHNRLENEKGTIAMARTSIVDSATAQFFINVTDNEFLNYKGPQNYGYCVFGKVVSGMSTIDKIKAVNTTTKNGHENVPIETIEIRSITRVKN